MLEAVPTAASYSMDIGLTAHIGPLNLDVGLLDNAQRLRARGSISEDTMLTGRHPILNTPKVFGGTKLVHPFTTRSVHFSSDDTSMLVVMYVHGLAVVGTPSANDAIIKPYAVLRY